MGQQLLWRWVVNDLKSPISTDTAICRQEVEIEEVQADIKASNDPDEKKLPRKKEEQFWEDM